MRGRVNVGGGYQIGSEIPRYELQRIGKNKVINRNEIWTYTAPEKIDTIANNPKSKEDNNLYMQAGRYLIKVAPDGTEIFKKVISSSTSYTGKGLYVFDDAIYCKWRSEGLSKFDLNGNEIWSVNISTTYGGLFVDDNQTCYFSIGTTIKVYDKDGNFIKDIPRVGGIENTAPVIVFDNGDYISGGDGYIKSYDVDGNVLWSFSLGVYNCSNLIFNNSEDGVFYSSIVGSLQYIRKQLIADKTVVWQKSSSEEIMRVTTDVINGITFDIYGERFYVNGGAVLNINDGTRLIAGLGVSYLGITVDNIGHFYLIDSDGVGDTVKQYNNEGFVDIFYKVIALK
ncbi:hypothetical protein [Wukongibacter sp. M2B1]|uniref:hypothetical protein n=1 Tax=Wukongibacter sp. M2B1 TaxID=3088895 RepID=UPI003D7922F7